MKRVDINKDENVTIVVLIISIVAIILTVICAASYIRSGNEEDT